MKTSLFFLTLCFLSSLMAGAQAPAIEWQKCLGGSDYDDGQSIQQTTDGGYIVTGFTFSNNGDVSGNHGGFDFWVVKLSSTGNLQWQKCLGGSLDDQASSIRQTTDGGYIVAGHTKSNNDDVSGNHGGFDFWVVKLNTTGELQWQKCLGGSNDEAAWSIQQTTDGGYIVAGRATSNNGDVSGNHGGWDCWVVKLNGTGDLQWQKCLGGTNDDQAISIQQITDGGYIVAGEAKSNNGDVSDNHRGKDYWIVKLNSTGNLQWQKCLGGTFDDQASSIQQTSDGGYIVAGYANSNNGDVSGNHGGNDYWVVKLDSTGDLQWQKCLGGTISDVGISIQQTIDGGYIIAGYANSNNGDVSGNHGFADYWVVKLNVQGELQWQKCLGGSSMDVGWAESNLQTTDGGYIVAGATTSNDGDVSGNHGNSDYWVVKLTEEGLAIHLLDISACNEDSRIRVQWETASEDDGDSFVLERSADGENFHGIASLDAKGTASMYTYHDEQPLQGVNYYRLRMNNIDGQIHYSKLVTALMSDGSFTLSVYPNPAKDKVTIVVNGPVVDGTQVYLTDMAGKTIKVVTLDESTTDIKLQGFARGMYLLQLHDGFYNQIIRLEVE